MPGSSSPTGGEPAQGSQSTAGSSSPQRGQPGTSGPQNGSEAGGTPGSEPGGQQQGQTADSGTSGLPGESGLPGPQSPGGQAGESGQPGDSSGQAGNDLPSYGEAGTGNGDLVYGSEDDPFGTIGSNTTGTGSGGDEDAASGSNGGGAGDSAGDSAGNNSAGNNGAAGSTQARVGELDERLEEGYGEFDGMILAERERAQGMGDDEEQNARTRGAYGGGMPGEEGGQGEGDQQEGPIIARNSRSNAGGGYMPDSDNREGDFDDSSQGEQYPVPEDIPEGNDDDVVARQLREAAMSEPDPEVRERLWDEYRRYTGLPVDDGEE